MKILFTKSFLIFFTIFSLIVTNCYSQLNGAYTVGNSGNYTTISSAVSALVANGVSGPVVFNILTGTYNESVEIDSVPGTNSVSTVTFRSMTGNYADVEWKSMDSVTLRIDGADYLVFQNITFNGAGTSQNTAIIEIAGQCDNLIFDVNRFMSPVPLNDFSAIYGDNFVCRNLRIINNTFKENIFQAIFLNDAGNKSFFCVIENNDFFGDAYPIVLKNQNSLTIKRNSIRSFGNGIIIDFCDDFTISYNKIGGGGGRAVSINSCSGSSSLIANNFINCSVEGMRSNSNNQKFYFNTITGGIYGFIMDGGSGNSFYNNIVYADLFAYAGINPGMISDYNDFFTSGPFVFVY